MKKFVVLLILVWWLAVPTLAISDSSRSAASWTGNINAFLGMKYLDEYDWEPIEDQPEFGFMVDFKQEGWPVSIAIDFLVSSETDTYLYYESGYGLVPATLEGATSELCFGFRKIWDHLLTIRPFIGGGIAFMNAELEERGFGFYVYDDDYTIGMWIGGGVYWTLAEHFNIGFDVRWSKAEVRLFGVDSEAGGSHFGLLLGYHW